MSKVRKFTFKLDPKATGLQRAASLGRGSTIRLAGKDIGRIIPPHWSSTDSSYRINLNIRCDEHPGWKVIRLKPQFASEALAREYLAENAGVIQTSFALYGLD